MILRISCKTFAVCTLSLALAASSSIPALAGTWTTGRNPDPGRLYYDNNGSYVVAAWSWIDGYCYCFDENGYVYLSCTTPDFHQVDAQGRLVVNGQVQTAENHVVDPTAYTYMEPADGISLGSWNGDTYTNTWSNYQITLPCHLYEDIYNPPRSSYDDGYHDLQSRFLYSSFRKHFYDFNVYYEDKTTPKVQRPRSAGRSMRMGYYNLHRQITPEVLKADIEHYIRYSNNTWMVSKGNAVFDGYAEVTIAGDTFTRIRWISYPDSASPDYSDCYFRALDNERVMLIETDCSAEYLADMEATVQSLSKISAPAADSGQ